MFHSPLLILREYIVTSVAYVNGRVGRAKAKPTIFKGVGGYNEVLPTLRFTAIKLRK